MMIYVSQLTCSWVGLFHVGNTKDVGNRNSLACLSGQLQENREF